MAVHDYDISNQSAPAFRSDLNQVLDAIVSNNSSATAPSTTFANMWWVDTANNYLKIRDKNDSNWIIVAEMDVTNSRIKLVSDSLQAASAGGIDIKDSSGTKILDLSVASEATARAGTNNTEIMTPLRVKQSATPVGAVFPFAGTQEPTGYVFCFGQSLSTVDESSLHSVISNTYGGTAYSEGVTDQAGQTTTFKVPDLRGHVVAGRDDMGGTSQNNLTSPVNGDTLGARGGSQSHTLTISQMPSHNHTGVCQQREDFNGNPLGVTLTKTPLGFGDTRGSNTASAPSLTINNKGGGSAHNNVQPTIILNYIIKT